MAKKNQEEQEEMELCLCPSCAGALYSIPGYRIIRKDPYQIIKESCTYCSSRMGYDFLVSRRSSMRKRRAQPIRTLESEAENE